METPAIETDFQIDTSVIEQYIENLMSQSTPEFPAWNVEKARIGKKSDWDYIDGCMILGLLEIYKTSGQKKYLDFADFYEDFRISEDGTISGYEKEAWNLDELNGGKNLFTLYKLTKKEKYHKALEKLYEQIKEQPRTPEGNFWHKKIYPNQIWLDGLYMALPFYLEYEITFNDQKNKHDIYNQFFNVEKFMRDCETGLYFHGYDSSRSIFWADKKTGLSKNFWLRSLGWYSMALLDTLNLDFDRQSEDWQKLHKIFVDYVDSVLKFQDKSGMWFQVPNFPNCEKNYLEASGSSILAYSLLKGYRTKILEGERYKNAGIKAFKGICEKCLTTENGKLGLSSICLVAGLGPESHKNRDGTYEYYMSEPIVKDDAKGVGPFLLAYNEYKLLEK